MRRLSSTDVDEWLQYRLERRTLARYSPCLHFCIASVVVATAVEALAIVARRFS